jgi:hypothetical protein
VKNYGSLLLHILHGGVLELNVKTVAPASLLPTANYWQHGQANQSTKRWKSHGMKSTEHQLRPWTVLQSDIVAPD